MIPAILKILLVFAAMLLAARLKVALGLALMAGGLALNLWAGCTVPVTLAAFGRAWMAADLWLLLAVTVLIIEIGRHLTRPDNAEALMAAVRRWGGRHGRAVSLMGLPAMVGLVPMPAGALFSAPFVEQAGDGAAAPSAWKSAVNYWFRHVWEYWWPLYPGVIVAMSIFPLEGRQFIAVQAPFTLVSLFIGYRVLIRPHGERLRRAAALPGRTSARAWLTLLPLALVLAGIFVLPPLWARLFPSMPVASRKLLGVLGGLLLGVAVTVIDEHVGRRAAARGWREAVRVVCGRKSLNILFTLAGVLIFKAMLDASGLLPLAARELLASGVPPAVAVAVLPFLAGMVTGVAVGFTGVSFPLVVGLLTAPGSGLTPMATLVLAYGFGYMGMICSPVHLCLLVTRDYFESSMAAILRRVAPCCVTVILYSLAAFFVLAALGW